MYYFGIIGVVIGTILSKVLTFVWYDPYIVYKHVLKKGLSNYFFNYIEKWLILFALALFSYRICELIPATGVFELLIDIIVVTLIVNSCYFLLIRNKKSFYELKNYLKNFFKKFKKH